MPQKVNQTKLGESSASDIIDYLIIHIFTYVIFTGLCQILIIFGIVTNIINIACFVKQGFSDTVTVNLLGLSVSDLASLITMVWTCISVTPAFVTADLPFESIEVAYLVSGIPQIAFTRVSSCITAVITLERCLSITFPLKVKHVFTPKRTGVITISIFTLFTFSATPSYVVNRLGSKFSLLKNKSTVGMISINQREEVEKIAFSINNLFIPFCAFVIVAVCTVVLATQLFKKAEWRKTATSDARADRISNRNLRVAKMVVAISSLFIACMVPTSVVMLATTFVPELWLTGKYMTVSVLMFGVAHVLEGINSSVNIFIYHHMSKKYRDTFWDLFKALKTTKTCTNLQSPC